MQRNRKFCMIKQKLTKTCLKDKNVRCWSKWRIKLFCKHLNTTSSSYNSSHRTLHNYIYDMIYIYIYITRQRKYKHSQLGNWVVIIIILILQLNFLELITFNTWISSYLSRKNTRRKLTLYIRNGSMITWNGCQWRIIVQFDLLYFIYKITALLKHIVSTCNGKTSYRA